MDLEHKTEKKGKQSIHKMLAYSFSFFLFSFLFGLFLDFIFPIKIFNGHAGVSFGVISIVLGSVLIFWSQKTARNFSKENLTKKNFSKGPYGFSRTPTHWGLFLLITGFSVVVNNFFVLLFTIISFIVAKVFFLRKQEAILASRYGDPYLEYQRKVKF